MEFNLKEGQKVNEEKQIRYSKYLIISFALIAVLITFFKLFCGGTSGNNNDVQGTVQRIADDNKQTGIIVELQKNNSRAKQILTDVELSNKTRKVQK